MPAELVDVTEQKRLNEAREKGVAWKKWGPYLSERQWGTVREDYSENGDAWNYFSHDQARSRAYRWGEDGLGGICDEKQRLCFSLALWNERDPILKERLFGLTNSEANHGEDVKEYYFYLDSTPTHSYMKYLYKYPQGEYPYPDLVETNRRRSREESEYELLDTGVFNEDRYFDIFVEYAKADPEDILIRITVHNRGPEAARLRVLPTLWFRNIWSWGENGVRRPRLVEIRPDAIQTSHDELDELWLYCDGVQILCGSAYWTGNLQLRPLRPERARGLLPHRLRGRHLEFGPQRHAEPGASSPAQGGLLPGAARRPAAGRPVQDHAGPHRGRHPGRGAAP